jgi:hypothetical protein
MAKAVYFSEGCILILHFKSDRMSYKQPRTQALSTTLLAGGRSVLERAWVRGGVLRCQLPKFKHILTATCILYQDGFFLIKPRMKEL